VGKWLLDSIISSDEIVFISSIVIFLLLLILLLKVKKKPTLTLENILKPFTKDEVQHIVIPDGIGGLLEINHIILLDRGILLIDSVTSEGNVFGGEKLDEWTQISKGRSYKFPNPLRRQKTSKQAISALVPGIPIFNHIVFSENAVFPRGKPDAVSMLSSLQQDLEYLQTQPIIVEKSRQAWGRLLRIARKDGQAANMDNK
jgi:hypothetical protein